MKQSNNNNSEINSEEIGLKIYYSKIKATIVVLIFGFIFTFQLVYSIINKHEFLALFSFIYIAFSYKGIKLLRFKGPIFIYNNGNLLYTKNSTIYTFEKYIFEIQFSDKYNFSQSLCIYDLTNKKLITENLWYINDNWEIEDIVKKMKLLKLLKIKNARI